MALIPDLARRLPDCRLQGKGIERRLVFQVDGVWLDARGRESPLVEIYIRTAAIPEFTMRARPRDPALTFEEAYELTTSDAMLTQLWLDEPARAALVAAAPADCDLHYERGEILIRRDHAPTLDLLEQAVRAGATLAARPHRLASEWLAIARDLGGTTTADRWDLGDFAATFDRDVRIDNRWEEGELRTRVRARRIASDGDRWMLADEDVPRRHRPRVDADRAVEVGAWRGVAADPDRLLARLRPMVHLLEAAAPDVVWTGGDEISLWWSGMVMSPAWIGPAVELVARLAVDIDAAQGPYR